MKIVVFCALLVLRAVGPALTFQINEKAQSSAQTIANILYDIVHIISTEVKISVDLDCSLSKDIVNNFGSLNDEKSNPMLIVQNGGFSSDYSHIKLFCSNEKLLKYQPKNINYSTTHKTFIYCPDMNIDFISKSIDQMDIHNFYLLESDENIQIMQTIKYSEVNCQKALSTVNTYNIRSKKWIVKNQKGMYMMQRNFKGCIITFGVYGDSMFLPAHITSGLNFEILKALEKKYNFNGKIKIIRNNEVVSIEHMFDNTLDVKTSKMLQHDDASWPLQNIYEFYLVSANTQQLSTFEKILMTFDQDTWMYIVVSILLPIISIQIINCLSESTKNFIYGGKVSSPTFNVLAIFFGVRQTPHSRFLPRRSSSRMLFILFIFYSLIIRTCYQKLSFRFLTHDIYPYSYHSIHDLIENNYTVISLDNVSGKEFIDIFMNKCQNKNSNYVIIMNSLLEIQLKHLLNRCVWIKSSINFEDLLVLSVLRNNELSDLIIETVNSLIGAGILNIRMQHDFRHVEYLGHALNFPKVLTLSDLNLYFEIWLVSLLLPTFAFICEVIVFKSRRQFRIGVYEEQNTFDCISLNNNAEEIQTTQNIQDTENEEVERESNHSDVEEHSAISVEEKENAIEMTVDQLQTTEETSACSEKDEEKIQDKTDSDNIVKEEVKNITADSSIDVSK